jgi:hypothetical protein
MKAVSVDGAMLDEVLAEADAALHAAKRAGRNSVVSSKTGKAGPLEPALRSALLLREDYSAAPR